MIPRFLTRIAARLWFVISGRAKEVRQEIAYFEWAIMDAEAHRAAAAARLAKAVKQKQARAAIASEVQRHTRWILAYQLSLEDLRAELRAYVAAKAGRA